jgi:acetamidase/formamidase
VSSGGSIHHVGRDAFSYVWDNFRPPALEVDSGETLSLHARDASNGQIGKDSTADAVRAFDLGHVNPVSGPVFVKGAMPGDVLAVELLEFKPSDWGWTALIPGFGLLADEFPDPWLRISEVDAAAGVVRFSDRVSLPLRAFPGTIGVAPAEPGEFPILPPSRWGGNLDIRHLEAGTTLFLPVGVEGALLSVGDTHAAQGDGEVCGTAIESAMDVVLRVTVRRDLSLDAPAFDVPASAAPHNGYHVCTGVKPDLFEATRDAVRAMIVHLQERHDLDREEAYALTSIACDLRIHEVVDAPNWVVGLFLPHGVIAQ